MNFKAIGVAADFESAMSEVGAISGATGDDFIALSDKAKEMGEKTKFSASESAEALKYMAMAGWKTEDMLSGLEGVMNLAAASGEDLGTTSDIVTDALTAFGMTAADSGHFADILAAASSNANTNVGMMGETFKYAAPLAGALGYSAEDVALAIGLMANSGIKASSTMIEMFISQGAVSGDTVSTEPADDVFLAIIAQYQRIAGLMNTYDELAKQCSTQMTELKAILTAINAYDVEEVTQRLNQIEDRMIDHVNLAKQIQNREIILRDVGIHFADKICRVENAAITENSLCDVYFDEYSYEIAAKALILPVAHDGYLDLTSSVDIREELTANILVRRA